jgi:translocator assembly and maintenance protein 41
VAMVQNLGAGVYYNTAIQVGGRNVKYGVISRAALEEDLQHWTSVYISGRMHKPVHMLRPAPPDLARCVSCNHNAALSAALLLLPARFEPASLFREICGLSYGGDVRMGVGESHEKPSNIAEGQEADLLAVYGRHISQSPVLRSDGSMWRQDMDVQARSALLASLPSTLQTGLLRSLGGGAPGGVAGAPRVRGTAPTPNGMSMAESLVEATTDLFRRSGSSDLANAEVASALRGSIQRIVRRASLAQTVKGVFTAGIGTSLSYALVKIRRAR